ncbi:MAG: hypothetical protein HY721_13755 [Planctomycetes bacterium]|nr:hypothetical protein [Planctomycetota bacterium]
MRTWALPTVLLALAACDRSGAPAPTQPAAPPQIIAPPAPPAGAAPAPTDPASSGKARLADYERAKRKARAWLDALEVDPVELLKHEVKGTKKLAEILDTYWGILEHTKDPADRAAILLRVAELAKQAARPEYHELGNLPDREFTQNSMSYLRVAWLLERFGLDTREYREHILRLKPRLDEHLRARGPWQRAMFLEYYDRFGLEHPPGIPAAPMKEGVIARRVPAASYDDNAVYDLTHEVFVAYDYGGQRKQTRFSAEDLAYTREVLPYLVRRYVAARNADLTGELLSCMTYLGWHDDPASRQGLDYLLDAQNPTGTWGDYEAHRPKYGKYLEHHVYLHTTMVALDALMSAYEGGWPPAPPPAAPGAR